MTCNGKECKFDHKMLDQIFEKHEQEKKAGAVLVEYNHKATINRLEKIALEKIECEKHDRRSRD